MRIYLEVDLTEFPSLKLGSRLISNNRCTRRSIIKQVDRFKCIEISACTLIFRIVTFGVVTIDSPPRSPLTVLFDQFHPTFIRVISYYNCILCLFYFTTAVAPELK